MAVERKEIVWTQPDEFKRLGAKYGALWTPTVLVIDSAGEERHRIEGFLPVDDFLAQQFRVRYQQTSWAKKASVWS